MTIKFHKTILRFFLCTLALIALSACGGSSGGGGGGATTCAPNCDPGVEDPTIGYLPSTSEVPPSGGWVTALDTARSDEYKRSTGADRIGAAYAHARGYTGKMGTTENPVIVSTVGKEVDRDHPDLAGKLVRGYGFHISSGNIVVYSNPNAGTCSGDLEVTVGSDDDDIHGCGTADIVTATEVLRIGRKQATHIAAIIAGKSDNSGVQGIAYGAQIKPIGLYAPNNLIPVKADQRTALIAQASGSNIAVMNNNWGGSVAIKTYSKTVESLTTNYNYFIQSKFQTAFTTGSNQVTPDEITAWETAAETTVIVFGAGDFGFNSETGMIRLHTGNIRSTYAEGEDVAWTTVANADTSITGDINRGGTHTTLPTLAPDVDGKILSVVALDRNSDGEEVIHEYSNGCGEAMAWCLGAPGVAINSAIPGTGSTAYETLTGTGIAAAHVTGAVAVLKGAFPSLTPTQLVSIILNTADYIPLKTGEVTGSNTNAVYGHGSLNLARATDPFGSKMTTLPDAMPIEEGITIDNSGITLPTSFGESLNGFTVGFIDDYNRAYIGSPTRITRTNAAFTLGDTIATWDSPELQSIALDSNSKMQFTNYDASEDAKDTLIFTHSLPNHTIGFSYNEESKTPDLSLTDTGEELHFQKIRPIASDLMQVNSTHKLGKAWNVKNAITSGEFDTGNRFNEAMANLNYTGENHNLTIGAGTLQEYGQFLGASGTGAYQLSDATQSTVTHLALTQNLPRNSAIKLKYTGFKTSVDMRYNNFAKIDSLSANEYQLGFAKNKILSKNDSLNLELIQPFAVTDGKLQQSTVLGYNEAGDYNNVTQNYSLAPTNRRQQIRMTWQNQINPERKTRLFISMQYENHVNNLRDKESSQILGGISTRF